MVPAAAKWGEEYFSSTIDLVMWRVLLNNWIQEQARAKIFETVQQASEGTQPPGEGTEVQPPKPADVGVVFALGIESGGLVDLLDSVLKTPSPQATFRQGGYRGRNVLLVETGVGRENAARGTELLIAAHQPPWVISAGFAGALSPQLKRGDLLLVNQVVDAAGESMSIDVRMSPEELGRSPGLHLGRLVTLDKVVRLPEEKRALAERHDALAVDMETLAVAEVCRNHKVRFLAVRVISDAVDEELPDDIERLTRQRTFAGQLGAAAAAIWNRPASVKQMWALKENALVASDRLAKFLAGMITQLAPPRPELPREEIQP